MIPLFLGLKYKKIQAKLKTKLTHISLHTSNYILILFLYQIVADLARTNILQVMICMWEEEFYPVITIVQNLLVSNFVKDGFEDRVNCIIKTPFLILNNFYIKSTIKHVYSIIIIKRYGTLLYILG